ncbi:MAG: hypothetical protein QM820_27070 [Minicystis sp.]
MTAPRWTAVLSVAASAAVSGLALVAIRPLFGDRFHALPAALLYAIAVAIVGAVAAHMVLARGARALPAVGFGALSGALSALLSLVPFDEGFHPAQLAVMASLVAAGAIAGAVLGVFSLVTLRPAASVERAPSPDGFDRVLLPAAIEPAIVGALAVLGHGSRFVPGLLVLAACAGAFAIIAVRDRRRAVPAIVALLATAGVLVYSWFALGPA